MREECFGSKTTETNCRVGPGCGNRDLQVGFFPKVELFKAANKGIGVRSLQRVAKKTVIFEYVGEVIDTKTYEYRQRLPHPLSSYLMELNKGLYIDAYKMGNASRFTNHSCMPNCRLELIQLRGVDRVKFVALRNIEVRLH